MYRRRLSRARLPPRTTKPSTVRFLTLSIVKGDTQPPLDYRPLGHYFKDIIQSRLDKTALVCPKELPRPHGGPASDNMGIETHLKWNYAEFDRHIQALARGLIDMGVQKGDRVAVVMGNNR